MKSPSRELARALAYEFKDEALLRQALTHRSAGGHNNERLEFLGDAILGMVIATELFQRLPNASEGELSRTRASLVKRETLAEVAREIQLGDYLALGSGELKSGGYRRASTLADALEAIFGAIAMDRGFDASEACIRRLFAARLEHLPSAASLKDPKTRLQEYLQSRHLELPEYEVVDTSGQDHNRVFSVQCRIAQLEQRVEASGSSRRRAEQAAAEAMLEQLGAAE